MAACYRLWWRRVPRDPKLPRGLMGRVGLAPRTKVMQYFASRLRQGASSTVKPMQKAPECVAKVKPALPSSSVPARLSNSVRKGLGI